MPISSENNAPTALEQELLELLNRARLDPQGEYDAILGPGAGARIGAALAYFGVDTAAFRAQLAGLDPVAPLAWSGALARAAAGHNARMIAQDDQSHQLPGELSLSQRALAAGYPETWRVVTENTYAYGEDSAFTHASFFVDWGYDDSDLAGAGLIPGWATSGDGIQDPAAHRDNILSAAMREVGIAVTPESDPATGVGPYLVTQDFGDRADYRAQLLGVVMADADGDAFYDAGEGLGGITVQAGGVQTTTWSSGGYQMVLAPGTYTVTFSGGDLPAPVTRQVVMGAENLKLDILAGSGPGSGGGGSDGNDTLPGSDGPDLIEARGGNDLAYGAAGSDTLSGGAGNDTLYGGSGDDVLSGGEGADLLGGGAGNDSLTGDAGADALWTAGGNDTARGGGDNDTLGGADGNDSLSGDGGNDELWGARGDDTLLGGAGDDTLGGFTGNDSLEGGEGADELWGAAGDDTLWGGTGNDQIGAGSDSDLAWGGAGNDTLSGGAGNDTLRGDDGADLIFGAAGRDLLAGGTGNDTLYGGAGADTFLFEAGDGDDRVFAELGEDILRLESLLWSGSLTEAQVIAQFGSVSGADYVLAFAGGDSLALAGQAGATQAQLLALIELV